MSEQRRLFTIDRSQIVEFAVEKETAKSFRVVKGSEKPITGNRIYYFPTMVRKDLVYDSLEDAANEYRARTAHLVERRKVDLKRAQEALASFDDWARTNGIATTTRPAPAGEKEKE